MTSLNEHDDNYSLNSSRSIILLQDHSDSPYLTIHIKLISGEILTISVKNDRSITLHMIYLEVWNCLPEDIKKSCKPSDFVLLSSLLDYKNSIEEHSQILMDTITNGDLIYLLIQDSSIYMCPNLCCTTFKHIRDSIGRPYKLITLSIDCTDDDQWNDHREEYENFQTWKCDIFIRIDSGKPVYYPICDVCYNDNDKYGCEPHEIVIQPLYEPCHSISDLMYYIYQHHHSCWNSYYINSWKTMSYSIYVATCKEWEKLIEKSLTDTESILYDIIRS